MNNDLERRKELLELFKGPRAFCFSGQEHISYFGDNKSDIVKGLELLIARDEEKMREKTPAEKLSDGFNGKIDLSALTKSVKVSLNKGSEIFCYECKPKITKELIIDLAEQAIGDRAASRDLPNGERSMKRTVELFRNGFDSNLSELQGWNFMISLKLARAEQGKFNLDDYVDGVAYCALANEVMLNIPIDKFFEAIKSDISSKDSGTVCFSKIAYKANFLKNLAYEIAKMGEEAAKNENY